MNEAASCASGRRRVSAWFCTGLVALLLPFVFSIPALAQAQPVRTVVFEDPEVLCHILHHQSKQRITALGSFDELDRDPADTILIVFGNPQTDNAKKAIGRMRSFQERGGAVLLATDRTVFTSQLPIRISSQKVQRPESFEGDERCPWLARIDTGKRSGTWDPQHPIFQLVLKGIATNLPGSVHRIEKNAAVVSLLSFPVEAKGDVREDYIVGSPRDAPPHGRALYVAGHGVFMNGMLLQKKADNFRFAMNVVAWLAEAAGGKQRSKALLIVDGTIVPDFDLKLTPPLPIPVPPRAIINRLLRDIQEEGRIQDGFYGFLGNDLDRTIAYALSFIVVGLLAYGAKKLLQGRHQVDAAVPRMVGMTGNAPLTPSVVQAQQIATLLHANLRREACQLTRVWLHQEFGIAPERWNTEIDAQLRVQRYFWSLGATQAQANLVVRIASIATAAKISQGEFLKVTRILQALSEAARAGRVTLLIDGKTVIKAA